MWSDWCSFYNIGRFVGDGFFRSKWECESHHHTVLFSFYQFPVSSENFNGCYILSNEEAGHQGSNWISLLVQVGHYHLCSEEGGHHHLCRKKVDIMALTAKNPGHHHSSKSWTSRLVQQRRWTSPLVQWRRWASPLVQWRQWTSPLVQWRQLTSPLVQWRRWTSWLDQWRSWKLPFI